MNNTSESRNHPDGGEGYPEKWNEPDPETLAEPTYWPMIMAAGITLLAWGVVTSYALSILGLGLIIVATVNWIGDIRHEQRQESAE